jgi:hypothetical protein
VQFRSDVHEIVSVSPGWITRLPVHWDLKKGGEYDDFSSTMRTVVLDSFLICVLCEQAADAR